ncbi:MAG: cryptochrome/photolyase family protein [Pirellulales bacterium]|nr:cryptochrome/photolyase family protein [Pirellulales bacterium]
MTMAPSIPSHLRHLVVVLGDQLDPKSSVLDGVDVRHDTVWMAEVAEESTHVWSHKARIALFLTAMRHYRDALRERGIPILYRQLDDPDNLGSLARELEATVRRRKPRRLVVVEPGEWRVKESIEKAARKLQVPVQMRADRHFLCTHDEFAEHASERKQLRMEYFYRYMRRKTGILMHDGKPEAGKWNFDVENRQSFGSTGPEGVRQPTRFSPDATTREVLKLVEQAFATHPGRLDHFAWPVTPREARRAMRDFISHRLHDFGTYQDAMWSGQPFLYHSLLSSALNLKLLDPRDLLNEVEVAYRSGKASLNSVEGFIRQILGWREYVRGIYWRFMPGYLDRNTLTAQLRLPKFFWTAETDMNCLRQVILQTLDFGYAHHIQRLMVTGLFALLLGVDPREVHQWYLAVYLDAVEWVELPNTLGMSQFADDGIMASKPYVASGKYIERMSNYCGGCRYDPGVGYGVNACPYTTLYWDFLARHRKLLAGYQRMRMQLRNLDRKSRSEINSIQHQAEALRNQQS